MQSELKQVFSLIEKHIGKQEAEVAKSVLSKIIDNKQSSNNK